MNTPEATHVVRHRVPNITGPADCVALGTVVSR